MTDPGTDPSVSQPNDQPHASPPPPPSGGEPTAAPPTDPTPPVQPVPPATQEWERTYAMFIHLTLLAVHLIPVPVVPALIMWLIKRDQSPFIDDHGKEAVNFQISLVLYSLVGFPLMFVCGIGIAVWVAAYILGIVGLILAAIASNKGQFYRYPVCLRFVK